jgi:hypothetical protein
LPWNLEAPDIGAVDGEICRGTEFVHALTGPLRSTEFIYGPRRPRDLHAWRVSITATTSIERPMMIEGASFSVPLFGSVSDQTRAIDHEVFVMGGWIHQRSAMAVCAESGRRRAVVGVVDPGVHRFRAGDYVLV